MATVEVTCTNREDGSSTLSLSGLVSMPDGRLYTLDPYTRFSGDKKRATEGSDTDFDPFRLDYAVLDHPSARSATNEAVPVISATDPSCLRPDAASAAPDVHLDIVIFVDYTVYQRWYNRSTGSGHGKRKLDTIENIRRYFGHVMNAVDLRFKTASPRYHVHLAGYVIETSVAEDMVRGLLGSGSTRTEVEGKWLLDSAWTLATRTSGFPANDHVIVFTEHTLYTVQEGIYSEILGIAYDGRMCHPNGYSISLTRYRGNLVDDVIAAAHEIGHSLGATHDDIDSSCTSSENNIMSEAHGGKDHVTQYNDYTFSECSARSFQKHVTSLESRGDSNTVSCLYDTITPSVSFLLPSLPGQLHDVHRQCQMLYSPSSFFCHIDIGGSENVCSRMPCYNPRTRRCAYHIAGEGTPCGNRKWCIAGACVHSTNAPAKHADCVFGNRPGPVYQGQDCDQTLGSKRHLCYSQRNRQVCCETCLKMATGPPVFGDCVDDEDFHDSSNASCTAETIATPTKCYDIAYYNRCCTACRVFHTNVTGCEFGDRDPAWCRTIDRLSCCDHLSNCCATCREDTQPLMCGYGAGSRSPRQALILVVLSLGLLI
ncbi:A disintegrin and metalloproteinase with thrombospondin motifs adt-1-like [Haliotis asinina]|uniref:A disintegrin and metalloproteinase with thrombospondin motifs adt-1-like n=1 Tax=Haliotis asinina TaxID=109174 RepID=UPI00353223A4